MTPFGAVEWSREGHAMWLLPGRALWWPEKSMLVVSDLHLAKAEHFRSKGLAVPPTVDQQTLSELTGLLRDLAPRTLLFLGDLFHSVPNRAWDDFQAWLRDELASGLDSAVLVRGNHDRANEETYERMGMTVVDSWQGDGVVFTHEPDDPLPRGTRIHVCGHVHPAVRLRGSGRQSERVACFVESSTGCDAGWRLTMPAFGAFTGTHVIEPRRGSEVYVVAGSEVLGPLRADPRTGFSRRSRR